MENPERPACAHATCTCNAREGSSYCSSWCENAALAATHEEGCQCGHAACETRSEFQPRFTVG
jgi:hypothetical protein